MIGFYPDAVGFLASWLGDCTSQVVRGGAKRVPRHNLWTASMEHVFRGHKASAEHARFQGTVFGDEMNC